jgi:CheY-like chemotaxis protein
MLERLGYRGQAVESGEAALAFLKEHQADLLLLDMTMPHMSGQETFQELRRVNPSAKVLLMSGYTEQEANSRFQGQGLSGFLQKPYTPQELNEKIHRVIESS